MNGYRIVWSFQGYIIVLKLLLLLQVELASGINFNSNGYYALAAPATISSGRPYGVALTTVLTTTSSFLVFVIGPHINMSMQLLTTPRFPSTSYVFDMPELVDGNYFLRITSLYGLKVENTTKLMWKNFQSFIKIQTSKMHYRPGEILEFRVFFHNEAMHGVNPDYNARVWIEDSKRNIVKDYSHFTAGSGIFKSELRLSQHPRLGKWSICAQNGKLAYEECAHIQVLKYELQAFKVDLIAPAEVNVTDESFKVSISARYDIEDSVDGNATLQIDTFTDGDISHEPISIILRGNLENGIMNATIPLSQFTSNTPLHMPPKLRLIADVCDLYGKKVYTISVVTLLGTYKDPKVPKIPPISSVLTLFDTYEDPNSPETPSINLRAKQKINFIKIENFGKPLKKKDKIIFHINRNIKNAMCVVVFNGLLLASKEVIPDKKTNDFEILIQFTTKMWPLAHIKLFSIESDTNALLIASQTIPISRLAHDHIVIEAPEQITAGEATKLHINAVPNSYVGLLAVDSRYTQIGGKSINDFTEDYLEKVKLLIRGSDSDAQQSEGPTSNESALIILSNIDNIFDVTQEVEFQHLSPENALTYNRSQKPRRSSDFEQAKVKDCIEIINTRKEVSDVWIFDGIKTKTKCEWTTLIVRVPDYITTWKLSAFSVDPNVGLTFLIPQTSIYIKSSKSIYMTTSVPYSIQIDEVLEIILNCYNTEEEQIEVTIGLEQDLTSFQLLDSDGKPLPETTFTEQKRIISDHIAINFSLRALRPGTITLTFTATSEDANDTLTRNIEVRNYLNVLSDQLMFYAKPHLDGPALETKLMLPRQPTADGVKCFFSGNVLPAKMQTVSPIQVMDTGEQLISKMISMYYIWKSVNDMSWLPEQYKQFLQDQLNDGYQSLMRLRRADGGFAYNDKPTSKCGSTWLTAFALRLFQLLDGTPFNFGSQLLQQCEEFLLGRIGRQGQFVELCKTSGRRKSKPLELNIDVLKVLELSDGVVNLQKPLAWTNEQMKNGTDYHLKAKYGFDPQKWHEPNEQTNISWMEQRRNLETAGRILSLAVRQKSSDQQFHIFTWLLTQNFKDPNNFHCYECSVAETAIYDYLQTQLIRVSNIMVRFWNNKKIIRINEKNRWTEQEIQLQTQNQSIYFKAMGMDELLVRCNYEYSVKNLRLVNPEDMHYSVSVQTYMQKQLEIQFCVTRLTINRELYVGTNIELQLPSGFVLDIETVQNLLLIKEVKQVNTLGTNTKLFLIMEAKKSNLAICLSVLSRRNHKVKNLQPGSLTVYDTNCFEKREVFTYKVTFNTSSAV